MFYFSPILALVSVGFRFVSVTLALFVGCKIATSGIFNLQIEANGLTLQFLNGISKIRVAGAENLSFVLWEKIFYQIKKIQWHLHKLSDYVKVVNYLITGAYYLIIYAALLFLVEDVLTDGLSLGNFIAFLASISPFFLAIGDFSLSVLDISTSFNQWKNGRVL